MRYVTRAFEKMKERKWDCIYVAIDLHGTALKATYKKDENFEYYPGAEEVLKYMSTREDLKLIIYTSSHHAYIDSFMGDAISKHIYFDYINENPEVETNKLSDFTSKWHFDIMLDDKAGFEGDTDWPILLECLKQNESTI